MLCSIEVNGLGNVDVSHVKELLILKNVISRNVELKPNKLQVTPGPQYTSLSCSVFEFSFIIYLFVNYIPINVTVINKYTISALLEGETGNFCATSGIEQNCKTGLTNSLGTANCMILRDCLHCSTDFMTKNDTEITLHLKKRTNTSRPQMVLHCVFFLQYCHFFFNNYSLFLIILFILIIIQPYINSSFCVKDRGQDLVRSIHCHNIISIMFISHRNKAMTGSTDAL